MDQLLMAHQQQPLLPQECTIIVLQPQEHDDEESNHIRMQLTFDPNATALEFKQKLHKYLSTSKYKDELYHEPTYYSELGITNDALSPHDIFEVN